jgi:hypothetical protein
MEPYPVVGNTVMGIYLDVSEGGGWADVRMCLVEATPGGTLIMRNPDDLAAMRVILSHINATELLCLMEALYAHRNIA